MQHFTNLSMKQIIYIKLLFLTFIVNAQNDKPEREPFTLTLRIDKEQFLKEEVVKGPYFVHESAIQIFPSEKLFIEVEIRNDTIYTKKTVAENLNPERTIEIDFKQVEENNEHQRMMLNVKNPFKKMLHYKAFIYIVGHDEWIPTSIIPVYPNISGIEMWNDIIISIALQDWKLE